MTDLDAPVKIANRGPVAFLTLDRPDTGNAFDVAVARSLHQAAQAVGADPAIRCVVVRSTGRMFCAGGDVKALHAAGDALPHLLDDILADLHPAILSLATMPKPVITAIHGPVAGAGVALAAVGDIALAEPQAHFTLAYPRIGLTPDAGATWLLPRLIGLRRTQELVLSNRRVPADEAAAIGLITRVVAEGSLTAEVDALAATLATAAAGALGQTKRLLLASDGCSLPAQLDAERDAIVRQGASAESREGLSAFAERRQPDFARCQTPASAASNSSRITR